ncbi:integrase core domain-containing protein [Tersicoccus sp. MR15.9]|uniref:integrase core domain-containing protein n=1 Tax=Tersicoccus mangrovi TaxID=3121635 RepID=UPI002FE62248
MSKRRLVITAVLAGSSQSEVARRYGVSQGWISRLLTRYRIEGEAAFEVRSRRPTTSPHATTAEHVELILTLRKQLVESGHDAGAETIAWHLQHHHGSTVSRATIHRILARHGTITPEPRKRPRSSYIRFQAEQPNETWQSDFTHYPLTHTRAFPTGVEIITWLDDHSRYALHITAHPRITAAIVAATFTATAAQHGYPASTLTDNGMVSPPQAGGAPSVRLAGAANRGGRSMLEHELRRHHVVQKNSRPGHPTTCGKVERFQQTMKNWLRAQPDQPATIDQLQALLDRFRHEYNTTRPHRSLPHRATPATAYTGRPKTGPGGVDRTTDTHDRVREDVIGATGTVTLRVAGQLRHIGIGRTHARTHVILLVQDLRVRVVNAATGELLRELTIDPTRDYQPTGRPPGSRK